jgi:NAD(P)-dependent dehydrogenase (short-subunit alcohol dehydrogenase family)
MKNIDLKNRTIIVTGGGKGIGKAIALEFAKHGADVVIADIDLDNAVQTSEEIGKLGIQSIPLKIDVTKEEDAQKMAEETVKRFGKIDVLCNNAGVLRMSLVEDTELEDWEFQFDVNCKGVFLCSKAVIPYMKEKKRGRIINTASQAGKTGLSLLTPYCASKAAVILFTKGLALEMAPYNILVNSVCPGTVNTDMTAQEAVWASERFGGTPESFIQKWTDVIPLKRFAEGEDIAKVIIMLASDYTNYMTGQAINVTGGQEMH